MNIKSLIKSGCIVAFLATFWLTPATHADTPAFTSAGFTTVPPPIFTGARGWEFFLSAGVILNPVAITQLGVFDSGGDGLANPHQVGFWRADGTLLASATVPAGTEASLVDGYRYVPIAPVVVNPIGAGYLIVAAQYSAEDADDLVTSRISQFAPGVTLRPLGRYGLGSDLPFPNLHTTPITPEYPVGPVFYEANFQFTVIPEPSVWFLLPPALGLLFLRQRKPE